LSFEEQEKLSAVRPQTVSCVYTTSRYRDSEWNEQKFFTDHSTYCCNW